MSDISAISMFIGAISSSEISPPPTIGERLRKLASTASRGRVSTRHRHVDEIRARDMQVVEISNRRSKRVNRVRDMVDYVRQVGQFITSCLDVDRNTQPFER